MGIVGSGETLQNVNLSKQNDVHLFIARKGHAMGMITNWENKKELNWKKIQIKESDFRSKTASFTTPTYLDLTIGQYIVLIVSNSHEGFGGIIMDVEYDKKEGLYTYQCQDWSRTYQSKVDMRIATDINMYRVFQHLITTGSIALLGNVKKDIKGFKDILSGLRPAYAYWEKAWGGTLANYNFMELRKTLIMRNVSYIEAIRDLVYSYSVFVDVYFDKYGVLHIEPYLKDEWLNTGLHLTTPEIADAKYKFDTTNVITGVRVHSADSHETGIDYWSEDTDIKLDLSVFFGHLKASVDNPDKNVQTPAKTTGKKTAKKQQADAKKTDNVYGTKKKNVYLTVDNIYGYNTDMKKLKDMKTLLEKYGWYVEICGHGAGSHTNQRHRAKKGIWFTLYGGFCAGTLREASEHNNSYTNVLKKNKSRSVVGFFPPCTNGILKGGKYYKHLGNAWDWQGSKSYAHMDYPARFMSNWGLPWMIAKNAKEMVAKFLAGGDNYATEGNSYKLYGSWQKPKHKVDWI